MLSSIALALLGLVQPPPAELKVVEYLKANVKPGEQVVVSELYNSVFTTPEERAALNRLFNTFFKIPLFAAQYQTAASRPPSLTEISEQFHFEVPGQAELMLRIMESDPRMPRFLERDAASGEITRVDVGAILAHPRFGKAIERTITGWVGRPAPAFTIQTYKGKALDSAALAGKPHLLYFWFTNCPPCLKTSPLLAELHEAYAAKGFEVVAVNADRALELPYTDPQRARYALTHGMRYTLAHMTTEMQEAFGGVSVFPTFFFVDRGGTIVAHQVNLQERATLEQAIRRALE